MITTDYHAGFSLEAGTIGLLDPPPKIRTWDWVKDHARTPDGKPFNWVDYPWTEGICDAWDRPDIETIWLMFAARCGKTLIAQSILKSAIAQAPAPAMYGASTESFVKQTMQKKLYPMFEHCAETEHLLPAPHKRLQTRMDLLHSTLYTAWSGSPTTLADLDPWYKHGGEIDKWTKDASEEADPLDLFRERGREVPDRKEILETTPTTVKRSRVYKGMLGSTNERWQVPCPHCGRYQELTVNETKDNWKLGGLWWDRDEDGNATGQQAYDTARYICRSCRKEWGDAHRRPAIRRGIWVPAGCRVTVSKTKGRRMIGNQLIRGPEAGFQLSRLCAPTFTFGDMARQVAISRGDPEKEKNTANSWKGEAYDSTHDFDEWDTVAERLCLGSHTLGLCPEDSIFCVGGVDVQIDHFVFTIVAMDLKQRAWCVDYGVAHTWEDVDETLAQRIDHADGGKPLRVALTLIDCRDGNRMEEVVNNCKELHRADRIVFPSMGSSPQALAGKAYKKENTAKSKKRRRSNLEFTRVTVNTNYWQTWIHRCLYRLSPANPGSLVMPASCQEDGDLWQQITNELPEDVNGKTVYLQQDETIPTDFRDAFRYARCGAEVYTRGAWSRQRKRRKPEPKPKKKVETTRGESPPASVESSPTNRPPVWKSWIKPSGRDRFVRG